MVANQIEMEQLVNRLQSMTEDAEAALRDLRLEKSESFQERIARIRAELLKTKDALAPFREELSCSQCFNILDNLFYSMENAETRISGGELRRGEIIAEFEILPLLEELREDLFFFALVYPDDERMKDYYQNNFARNHANRYVRDGKTRFDVSIVVVAWNKLEYTKLCMESLFEHTDLQGLNCELITINHGSDDGTKAYFESLPHEKKINLRTNMCAAVSSFCYRIAEGRYLVSVNNDVILTANWLENLLACMKSDDKIAVACPVTTNISNLQAIPVTYQTLDEMQEFAKKYNVLNPDLWEERIKLCPPVGILNMEILNRIGFSDRYFRYMEFADDDCGLRYRRGGYRQILLRDTFCHHFGSVTIRDSEERERTFFESKRLFEKKYGLDAWSHGACYDPNIIHAFRYGRKERASILGIDTGFGATPLQIKNELRRRGGQNLTLCQFTTEPQFAEDLAPYSDAFASGTPEELDTAFGDRSFDYIYLGNQLENYAEYKQLLECLRRKLSRGGQLAFSVGNVFWIRHLSRLLQFRFPAAGGRVCWINTKELTEFLNARFSDVQITFVCETPGPELQALMQSILDQRREDASLARLLKTVRFQFLLTGDAP